MKFYIDNGITIFTKSNFIKLKRIRGCLIIFLVFKISFLQAQQKLEKEYRLDIEQIPTLALDYVSSFNFKKNIKWYVEESLSGVTIEAKTKTKNGRYSLEFTKEGILEDVEIDVDEADLTENVNQAIHTYLSLTYKRYRIRKIQVQYSGDPIQIRKLLLNNTQGNVTLKYELIAKAKDSTGVHLYEFLFNVDGELEQKSKVIFRNSDNLEY